MAGEALERLGAEAVEQELHAGVRGSVWKEKWRLGDLALVRKLVAPAGASVDRPNLRPGLPKVVLVHGFAQNRYTWHSTRRSMSAWLAVEGFDVWNLELRGHGGSKSRGGAERFGDYVDDAAHVAEQLGEPAFWVGHSLGGAVAYAGATQFPMRGVVGIGALFRFAQANRALQLLCRLSQVALPVGDATGPSAGRSRALLGGWNIRTRLAGQLLAKLYAVSDIAGYAFPISGWAPGAIEPDILAERLERGFDWTSVSVWLEMARWGTTGRFDYESQWPSVRTPLLVVAGDLDHLMLPADARVPYDLYEGPDRTLHLLDDYTTGLHWGHLDLVSGKDAPAHTWTILRDWMMARAGVALP